MRVETESSGSVSCAELYHYSVSNGVIKEHKIFCVPIWATGNREMI